MGRLRSAMGSMVVAAACSGSSDATDAGDETSSSSSSSDNVDASTVDDGGTTTSSGSTSSDPDGSTTAATSDTTGGPFPGCGMDPGFDDVVVGTMDVDGVERSFVVSIPPAYDPHEGLALVFGFHGRGGTAEVFRSYAGLEQAAAGAAVFVYPQGLPLASMGGQTGWDLAIDGYDAAFVAQLLDDLSMNLCIDPDRVYATGHSFGGYFSNTLGCALSDRLRAIGPVAGGGPFGACPDPMAAIVIHGIDDEVVATSAGEQSRDHWRSNNGCSDESDPAEPSECVRYQGCDADLDVVWCLHDESPPGIGTHTWPSFAGATIWAFFAAHGA